MTIESAVKQAIEKVLNVEVGMDEDLNNRIDSLQALEILVLLEQNLDVEVQDDDLYAGGWWQTPRTLAQYFSNFVKA